MLGEFAIILNSTMHYTRIELQEKMIVFMLWTRFSLYKKAYPEHDQNHQFSESIVHRIENNNKESGQMKFFIHLLVWTCCGKIYFWVALFTHI